MFRVCLSIIAILASTHAWAGPIFNGKEYSLTTVTDWASAQAEAVAAGGHLVAISDVSEQNFLTSTFGTSEIFWIGLTDQETEGTFKWVTEEALTYTNWHGGEPNNTHIPGGENWVIMNFDSFGRWGDCEIFGCSGGVGRRGIIETQVPEPSVLVLLLSGLLMFSIQKKGARQDRLADANSLGNLLV